MAQPQYRQGTLLDPHQYGIAYTGYVDVDEQKKTQNKQAAARPMAQAQPPVPEDEEYVAPLEDQGYDALEETTTQSMYSSAFDTQSVYSTGTMVSRALSLGNRHGVGAKRKP